MPVTVRVADHGANRWSNQQSKAFSSEQVLSLLNKNVSKEIGEITMTASGRQTSLSDEMLGSMNMFVNNNGLVRGALHAYNNHHHLVLRPEDIWFAILTQFSFYVNAHSEELRSSFVPHEGRKGLVVEDPGQPSMALMCRNMTKLIEENIVDPKLREWIMPNFTTTTMHDEVVASIIMMGTLQTYFDFVFDTTFCGIPTVTLLGEMSDWEEIQQRIEKLNEYGEEPTRFCAQLRPLIANFIATFSSPPDDESVKDFWSRIIDHHQGSGLNVLTGWMITFCFWDEDGKRIAVRDHHTWRCDEERTVVPAIDIAKIPAGFVSVPVMYINPDGIPRPCKLLAGFVGHQFTESVHFGKGGHGRKTNANQQTTPSSDNGKFLNCIQPVTAWWMFSLADVAAPKSGQEYYLNKMAGDWNGQASTGSVARDGNMVVKDGLPDRIFRTLPDLQQ